MDLTNQADEGRKFVGLLCIIVLCFELNVIVDYLLQFGTQKFATNVIRFLLTSALLFWLYQGSGVARWLCVVLFGLGGLAGAYAVYSTGKWLSPYLPVVAFHLFFPWQLMRSPRIRDY
ncbi:MAG: hypothetical protein IBJ08_17290, partial [Pseudomonas sp.]|nr:hypothetical protein [Pseudomonas sp.]